LEKPVDFVPLDKDNVLAGFKKLLFCRKILSQALDDRDILERTIREHVTISVQQIKRLVDKYRHLIVRVKRHLRGPIKVAVLTGNEVDPM